MIKEYIKRIYYKPIIEIERNNSITLSTFALHQKTFPRFKNIYTGKEVVICGAGPTLKNYNPIPGAIHIAVNRAFLYSKVKFDYIFAQDYAGIKMVEEEMVRYYPEECIKLLGEYNIADERQIPESLALKCNALRFNVDTYFCKNGYNSKFVVDIDRRALGGMPNVGMSVLQFALYTNPIKVYIVGCDMSGAHFVKGNLTKEEESNEKETYNNYWRKDLKKMLIKWNEIKQDINKYYPETHIISVNPVGLKGIFEDMYQN